MLWSALLSSIIPVAITTHQFVAAVHWRNVREVSRTCAARGVHKTICIYSKIIFNIFNVVFFHVGLCGTITFEFWSYHYRCVRVRQYQSVAAARERATDYTLHFKLLLLCPRRVRSIAMCVSVCMSVLERRPTVFQKKNVQTSPNFRCWRLWPWLGKHSDVILFRIYASWFLPPSCR